MSADNWDICPRCLYRARGESAARLQTAADFYGKVSPEEYERLRAEAQVAVDAEDFRTFREDYEFYGASEGVARATYTGACQTCKLSVNFDYAVPFFAPETGEPAS